MWKFYASNSVSPQMRRQWVVLTNSTLAFLFPAAVRPSLRPPLCTQLLFRICLFWLRGRDYRVGVLEVFWNSIFLSLSILNEKRSYIFLRRKKETYIIVNPCSPPRVSTAQLVKRSYLIISPRKCFPGEDSEFCSYSI